NGENTWDFPHHAAISRVKRKRREFLEAHRTVLTRHLRDYRLPLREAVFPVDHGAVVLDLT
ncbi:MAG TPA: hypothetical protein VK973_05025, partial [Arenicellales bacterium]|nr:hypothetical protein [Arenicellales bacterium]